MTPQVHYTEEGFIRIIRGMQSGEYIVERMMPAAISSACTRHGIGFNSLSDDWVLRLTKGATTRWVIGYKFDINPAGASAVAQDKVASYINLASQGISAVPHVLARSLPHETIDFKALAYKLVNHSEPVVAKPLDGTGGRGVRKYEDIAAAAAHIQTSPEIAWAVSPWLDIITEIRLTILDGEVVLAYEKHNPVVSHGLKFYNLGLGAIASDLVVGELPSELRHMALAACNAFGLRVAAIDLVQSSAGKWYVLEVNDGIMMENYARQGDAYKARALQLYDTIIAKMF